MKGINKIQRSSSGAGNSLQKLVFQKSEFKQKPIFSITKREWAKNVEYGARNNIFKIPPPQSWC